MTGNSPDSSSPPPARSAPSPLLKMQPVQAVQAVMSLDSVKDGDFRVCEHCHLLLSSREKARQNRIERPIITQFYSRMRSALDACDEAVTAYHNVYSSLWYNIFRS